jgi:hypothetical protein
VKDRHHGGLEPPDDRQDRPEQNAGYDAVVHGQSPGAPSGAPVDDMAVDPLTDDAGADHIVPAADAERRDTDADARAESDAAHEVRRRESRTR